MKITDEMINRADNVMSRVKGGIPDATIRLAIEAALSAQVQDVKTFINLNSRVRVKLTKHGKIILEMYEYTTEKPDAEGFIEMHLWELMRVFGPVMFNGNPNLPFENMNVELLG